ncbi:hypothetical protein [Micromonospora citrea]|uniref:hypothetical protein n=1 Tax=Micromonospora citrea TaxID=47855 RepID=UPI001C407019|nr:hypothetical protein [Micromonospora citrea]
MANADAVTGSHSPVRVNRNAQKGFAHLAMIRIELNCQEGPGSAMLDVQHLSDCL